MKQETKLYKKIKREVIKKGFLYKRFEQESIPDIYICKRNEWYWIEVKVCYKKEIKDLVHDVHWRPGQLPFANEINNYSPGHYLLVVEHKGHIYFYTDPFEIGSKTYPTWSRKLTII
jgi:hypothetical protein